MTSKVFLIVRLARPYILITVTQVKRVFYGNVPQPYVRVCSMIRVYTESPRMADVYGPAFTGNHVLPRGSEG